MARPHSTPAKSFQGKYVVRPGSRCWIWIGNRLLNGYGIVLGKYAHRTSYELHNGPIPQGQFVCHSCDNPSCVNPEHLFAGTHQDNSDDMVRKGRQAKGARNGHAKLTQEQVYAIRRSTGAQRKAAAQFGVSHATIGFIRNNLRWAEQIA